MRENSLDFQKLSFDHRLKRINFENLDVNVLLNLTKTTN